MIFCVSQHACIAISPRSISTAHGGRMQNIASVEEATEFLTQHWPDEKGRKFRSARQICLDAMAGRETARHARSAFVAAAKEKLISTSESARLQQVILSSASVLCSPQDHSRPWRLSNPDDLESIYLHATVAVSPNSHSLRLINQLLYSISTLTLWLHTGRLFIRLTIWLQRSELNCVTMCKCWCYCCPASYWWDAKQQAQIQVVISQKQSRHELGRRSY